MYKVHTLEGWVGVGKGEPLRVNYRRCELVKKIESVGVLTTRFFKV